MINIVKNKKISFAISSIVFIISLALILIIGLKPSIDFTGGTLMEVSFTETRPEISEVITVLETAGFDNNVVQPVNEDGFLIRTKFISEAEHQVILAALKKSFQTGNVVKPTEDGPKAVSAVVGADGVVEFTDVKETTDGKTDGNNVVEQRIETIGPAISTYLKDRAWQAALLVILAIVTFIAYAFRKVSKPVKSWKFGVVAIVALVHDITITMGIFTLLGYFMGVEVGIPFVVALLTILGYSVNDTIVVFDRIREKIMKRGSDKFAETVNIGVNETLVRSLNTSITTLIVLLSLFLFGGESIKYFSLALIIGILLGTYSSIFLASPLLVVWEEYRNRK